MSTTLFRTEVVAARRRHELGAINLRVPRLGWVFFSVGLSATLAILLLLMFGHYTRHEQVLGMLVPTTGLITTRPDSAGVIARILVHEGDIIRAGQPLVQVATGRESVSLGDTQAAVAEQLQIKSSRLQSDLNEQARLEELARQDLQTRLIASQQQMVQLREQITLQQERADSAMALYQEWLNVFHTGVISKVQLLQQHDSALEDAARVKELKSQLLQVQQQNQQLKGQLIQIPELSVQKRNETERQIADVKRSAAENATQSAITLRATTDGTITNILVHPGQAVVAQQSLIDLLPADSRLQAELWVPTQAIGFIRPGTSVVLRYRAFPYQKFGQHFGRVDAVSLSAVTMSENRSSQEHEDNEPRYRVEVALDSQSVLAYGSPEALKPGMTLDADVILDRRRLIEWILEPLYGFTERLRDTTPAGPGVG